MPSYRERREAGEFAADKTAVEAIQEAAVEEFGDEETETPPELPKKSGVKVTDAG